MVARLIVASAIAAALFAGAVPAKGADPDVTWTVARMVLTSGVRDRQPVDSLETVAASAERAVCFLEATDISADTTVTVAWIYRDAEVHRYTLPLPRSPLWRTWAEVFLQGRTGPWRVDIRSAGDTTVRSLAFTVE